MVELKKVGVLSTAKMFAVLSLIGGIVVAVFAVAVLSAIPAALLSTLAQSHIWSFFAGLGLLLLIVIPILALVFGFVIGALEAWLYNIIAEKVGGAKLGLVKGLVQSLDPVSIARIVALIAGVVTLITFILMALFGVLASSGIGALATLGLGVLETVFAMIIEFVIFIIVAVVYNYLARKIGGIRVNIKANVLKRVEPVPFAKIYGIFTAILGLFYGIIFSFIFILAAAVPTSSPYMRVLGTLGAFSIVVFPILGFIFGFVYAAIYALVYNWIASKIEGIKLYFS